MKIPIAATTESRAVRMPNMKFNIPSRISPAMPTAKPPAQRVMPHAALTICGQYAPHSLSDVVQCHSHIFQFLDCCYLSCSDGEVGSSPFSFRLSVCPMSPCDVFRPRTGRFRFRGKSKGQGSRFSKFFRQNTT